jgi:aldehyde:ferredoxin oxidoreductase
MVIERETGLDYWVDAITNRGILYLMDDITGLCKFTNLDAEHEAEALRIAAGIDIDAEQLLDATRRTFLRGYAAERAQSFSKEDYAMPTEVHDPSPGMTLPYFNTLEFFGELRERVIATFDERAAAAGYL